MYAFNPHSEMGQRQKNDWGLHPSYQGNEFHIQAEALAQRSRHRVIKVGMLTLSSGLHVCRQMCVLTIRMHTLGQTHIYIHTYIHTYIHILKLVAMAHI